MARYSSQRQYPGSYGDDNTSSHGRYYGSSSVNYGRNEYEASNQDYDNDMRYGRSGIESSARDDGRSDRSVSSYGSRRGNYTSSNYGRGNYGSYDEDDYDSNYGNNRDYESRLFGNRPSYGRDYGYENYVANKVSQRYGQDGGYERPQRSLPYNSSDDYGSDYNDDRFFRRRGIRAITNLR